jgi:hypothetical protein
MQNLFEELEKELERLNAPVLPRLNSGLSEEDIFSRLRTIGISLPPDAVFLYKWHDGTKLDDHVSNAAQSIFARGAFPDLDKAIETYQYYTHHDPDFKKTYFMLFESRAGEMFLIDCDKESDSYGMILFHDISLLISPKVVTTMYDSISTFLKSIIECYQKGIYKFEHTDLGRILEIDFLAEAVLSKELNPKSKIWKHFFE